MDNQIKKFDPSKMMEGVKDRIKSTFVSLIPDDAWNAMVEKEIYRFTTGKIIPYRDCTYKQDENGNYIYIDWEERVPYTGEIKNWKNTNDADISPLQKMIYDMLFAKFKEDFSKYLSSEEYQQTWTEYGIPEASKAVKQTLAENTDLILTNIVSGMMQSAFNSMRAHIMNDVYQMQQRNY